MPRRGKSTSLKLVYIYRAAKANKTLGVCREPSEAKGRLDPSHCHTTSPDLKSKNGMYFGMLLKNKKVSKN